MSGRYYGRINYTCPETDDKGLLISLFEIIEAIYEIIIKMAKDIFKAVKF